MLRSFYKIGLRRLLEIGQTVGVDLLPRHFYSSIPDLRDLRRDQAWAKPLSMVGVRGIEIAPQLEFVRDCCAPYQQRLASESIHDAACFQNGAGGYGPTEADFLFCFIRHHRPARVIQIGAGVSTSVTLQAAEEEGFTTRITCVDPFPTEFLRRMSASNVIDLIEQPAQTVPLEILTDLKFNDLLFVDSTHAVKPGGEVNRIVLEVLPRLAPGVWVHFHDITFPYDYQPSLMSDALFFPTESTLLHAFLSCNDRFTVAAALSMLHVAAPDQLRIYLPNYRPCTRREGLAEQSLDKSAHWPSATYIRCN
jgi:predicted O-methyltransferase YrrM